MKDFNFVVKYYKNEHNRYHVQYVLNYDLVQSWYPQNFNKKNS